MENTVFSFLFLIEIFSAQLYVICESYNSIVNEWTQNGFSCRGLCHSHHIIWLCLSPCISFPSLHLPVTLSMWISSKCEQCVQWHGNVSYPTRKRELLLIPYMCRIKMASCLCGFTSHIYCCLPVLMNDPVLCYSQPPQWKFFAFQTLEVNFSVAGRLIAYCWCLDAIALQGCSHLNATPVCLHSFMCHTHDLMSSIWSGKTFIDG